ncbi:hypothetical protein ACFWIX_08235 [Pseudarthrobacter sp. NPDC058362]|uniref:hypothetical protein n=1 Tax=Pseudarthrobacter sp. NPDC058362 TaxID=3346458 RepID=UPI00364EDA01
MAKYELDYNLRCRMSEETWAEYKRLTVVANNPPWSEVPATRALYITGGVLTAFLLVPIGIAIGNSTDGGSSAVPWVVAFIVMLFLTLLVPLFTVFRETRVARERALAERDALARAVELKSPGVRRSYDYEDPVPHYPVTGEYNPSLYMARGGPAMAQWLQDTGYGDWETYEANKPD